MDSYIACTFDGKVKCKMILNPRLIKYKIFEDLVTSTLSQLPNLSSLELDLEGNKVNEKESFSVSLALVQLQVLLLLISTFVT